MNESRPGWQWPIWVSLDTGYTAGDSDRPGEHFKNGYELLILRAFKILTMYKTHIFQCMRKIFCVEFQRYPLKFHTKYLTHTLKDVYLIQSSKN